MNLRIGSVPYLNARPLVYGMKCDVALIPPSALAARMHRREIDLGLVPVAEVLEHDHYDIVDGIAIASHGAVRSVYLAHRVPVGKIRRVAVDTASRTSAWLVRVILKELHGIEPEFYPLPVGETLEQHEAMMLIGDEAIAYMLRNGSHPAIDLGEAWLELTGLPFVYAVWALQRGLNGALMAPGLSVAQMLREVKADGLASLEKIVQDSREGTMEFRREYLTRHVQFDLGPREKQSIARFQRYLKEMKLIKECHELRYIG
jgi:predicted solute-binding protein